MPNATAITWNDDGNLQVDGVAFAALDGAEREDLLLLFKTREMIDAYSPILDEFHGCRMVELGIFHGGSTGFFAVALAPERLVAFELSSKRIGMLDHLVDSKGLTDVVRLHYGVDQADGEAIATTVDRELDGGPLDLVIDDASHLYGPTVSSFEVLFPRLRPGGLVCGRGLVAPNPADRPFRGRCRTTRVGRGNGTRAIARRSAPRSE